MKLIILTTTTYKEKDTIVTGLSNDELITFSVKGLESPKSSNIILKNPLCFVEVKFKDARYKYPVCDSSSLIVSPYGNNDSLDKLALISLICESTNKVLQDEEKLLVYDSLIKAINAFKDGKCNPYQVAITYLGEVMRIAGYHFDINRCVFCGSKNDIVSFSFSEGGFICKNCYESSDDYHFTREEMLLIRQLLGTKEYTPLEGLNDERGLTILKEIVSFIYDGLGIKLNSFSLLV